MDDNEKKTSTGVMLGIFLLLVIGLYGFYWSASSMLDTMNSPVDPYGDCYTAEECYYNNPSCKTYATDGKDCIRDGMTGGFFDSNIYYICEGYGKMTDSCQDHYSFEEWEVEMDKMFNDVKGERDE